MSNIIHFNPESSFVSFVDKKGTSHSMSFEGATWKGGLALKALKDVAAMAACRKAESGNYRAFYECVTAGFPAVGKHMTGLYPRCSTIWGDAGAKQRMSTLVDAVLGAQPKEGKSWTDKQLNARAMCAHMADRWAEERAERANAQVNSEPAQVE